MGTSEGPTHLRLSVGAAERVEGEWRFVCPSTWGGPERPVMASTAEALFVFAEGGLVSVSAGVATIVPGGEDLGSSDVRSAATATDGTLFALVRSETGDRLVRVDKGSIDTVARLQGGWDSLTVIDGVPVLATVRDDTLVLAEVDPDGTGLSEREFELDGASDATATVRGSDRLTVTLSTPDEHRLALIDEDGIVEALRSPEAIHGPVYVGGSVFAVTDGTLWQLDGAASHAWDSEQHYTGASETEAASFLCSQTMLFQLFEGGPAVVPWFEHGDLLPPLHTAGACQGEWLDYAGHAGMAVDVPGTAPVDSDRSEPGSGGGCAATSPIAPHFVAFFLLLPLTRRSG